MKTLFRIRVMLLLLLLLPMATMADEISLAKQIMEDTRLDEVLERARTVVGSGFNAGDGYGEVWIRDLATFITLACEVHPKEAITSRLLMFFQFQGEDGNIVDGYIPKENANVSYDYIRKDSIPDYVAHKNTVETDQETSLIHAIARYVCKTGDKTILDEVVNGKTVLDRMESALRYLREHRYSKEYGLIWGATTADWGDVQPEHAWGVVLDESSHLAIDIYDNAMLLVAIDDFLELAGDSHRNAKEWKAFREDLAAKARMHLWDARRQKFIPHVYLDGSPFPEDLDENAIYYHGGTAIAIDAGLLSKAEIKEAVERMAKNVADARAGSIGLTLYPPYPRGTFQNPGMARPYSYQNGGDWTWFGGRMIQQLVRNGLEAEAYRELLPMVKRVIDNDGFYEWYTRDNKPRGSGTFRGSAGVLADAIYLLREWAAEEVEKK